MIKSRISTKMKTFKRYPVLCTFKAVRLFSFEQRSGEGKRGPWYMTKFSIPLEDSDRRDEGRRTLWLNCTVFHDQPDAYGWLIFPGGTGEVNVTGQLIRDDYGLKLLVTSIVPSYEEEDDNDD